MYDSDRGKEREASPNIGGTNKQDITHEHIFDLLVAFRGATEKKDCRRRSDDIADTNNCFLWDLACSFTGQGKNRCTEQSETESNSEGRPAFQIEAKQDCNTDAQRCHLCHSDVDEDDTTRDDMQSEVNQ